jgi:serine/threonine protein kinase
VPEQVLACIVVQVLRGLGFLHSDCRRFHRDIKPHNVLVSSSGHVKIADLGIISHNMESVTVSEATTFCGTLLYMAPERLMGETYTYSSDVWSFGIMLFQLVEGHVPYRQRNGFFALLNDITNQPVPKMGAHGVQMCESCSPGLVAMVNACLEKEPANRPSTAALEQLDFVSHLVDTPDEELRATVANWLRVAEWPAE